MASTQQYEVALARVSEGLSVRQAAKAAGVPYTSLQRRVTGQVAVDAKAGAKTLLTLDEEQAMAAALIRLSEAGQGFTRVDLKYKATLIALDGRPVKFGEEGVSDKWLDGFMKRWGEHLSLRKGLIHDGRRRAADNPEQIREYFKRVKQVMAEHRFADDHIWNCDESGQ